MLIHSVYFWLKKDASPEVVAQFEGGLRALAAVSPVKHGSVGKPAVTPERPVIEASYDWALIGYFDGMAEHDVYQSCQEHVQFLEKFAPIWERVQVFDVQT